MEPDDLRRIHSEAGASGVLSLQHDDCLSYWGIDYAMMYRSGTALGLEMERCPIRDFDMTDMRRRLPAAIRTLANMLARGHRVYVHCTAGMGRAPTVVFGYLTLVEWYLPDDAIRLILKGCPESVLAWEAYYGCREDLTARHRHAIERRAYEIYKLGLHGNARADWFQARAEILRSILTQTGTEY
ncbi:MAG: dual specificity protein phosphatase family protein [Desulfobacterales bacterium]